MTDLHCHILPGVDDGSGNISDSVEMAQVALSSGTKYVVATPHANIPFLYENNWGKEWEEKIFQLQRVLTEKNLPIIIYPGQEIFLAGNFREKLSKGYLIPLNFSVYPLVEVDMGEREDTALEKIQTVAAMGFVPVVAHPERYEFMMENPDAALELHRMGALLQVNRGSIFGRFGRRQMHTALHLLHHRLADFVASDAHSPYRRTPCLRDAHEWISENISLDYADLLLKINPEKVIRNEKIDVCM